MERLIKGDFVSMRKRKRKRILRKRKKKLTSLPYDLLLMIVARVPRSYYGTLSLVSKSFQSMVASPELYKVRSHLGLTESCIYVCLRIGFTSCKWYTLSSKTKSSGSSYVLARVPMPNDSPCNAGLGNYSDLVAVGANIYNIGFADKPSLPTPNSGVSILDCKSHTWRKGPSMPVELREISARVIDGKIYVLGRYHHQNGSWKKSFEVFNTYTQTWDHPCNGLDCDGITCEGVLHVVDLFDGMIVFSSKDYRWYKVVQYPRTNDIMFSGFYCEIDNVLYSVSEDGALRWYEMDKRRWRDLKGLEGLPKLPSPLAGPGSYVELTGYGCGKMMVLWNRNNNSHLFQSDTIYCAEIALERRNGDCWGKLEWYDSVLSVPMHTKLVKVLAVTL